MAQTPLASEKYWRQALMEEQNSKVEDRNGSAISSFAKFIFALGLIWLVGQCSDFFPAVVDTADAGIERSVRFLKTLIH